MDVSNQFMVGVQGPNIVILLPHTAMSKREALVFAAWLVTLADDSGEEFEKVLTAVQNI